MSRPLRVFLCHAREDKSIVRELYHQLTAEGWMDVWLDEQKLLPGQEWDIEIEKAVEQADVVIVCLSSKSVDKEGYVQKELRFVLNISDEKPEGSIFVVPLRLDDCVVPRRIRAWQYVDYFPKNNQTWAYQRLVESLKLRAARLGISTSKPAPAPVKDKEENIKQEPIATQKPAVEISRQTPPPKQITPAPKVSLYERFVASRIVVTVILLGLFLVSFIVYAMRNLFYTEVPTVTEAPVATTEAPAVTEPPTAMEVPTLGIGSTIISEKDDMTMISVPAGEFTMGSNAGDALIECQRHRSSCELDWFRNEEPPHRVELSAFWIDQTEVTNAMYSKFVQDTGYQTDAERKGCSYVFDGSNWNCINGATWSHPSGPTSSNSGKENFPVIHISWGDASTYCEWAGRRLPTEAEWEKAASWDDVQKTKRVYPWGESFDCSYANYYDGKINKLCIGNTVAVKSYESGRLCKGNSVN